MLEIRSSSQKPPSRLNQKKKELERFFKLHFDHRATRIFFFPFEMLGKEKKTHTNTCHTFQALTEIFKHNMHYLE